MPSAGFVQVLADGSVTALWLGYGLVEVKERLQVDRATYEGKLFPKKEAEKKDHECVPVQVQHLNIISNKSRCVCFKPRLD